MLLICRDDTVKNFWPLTAARRNEARERTPLQNPSLFSFDDLNPVCLALYHEGRIDLTLMSG